MNHAGDLKYTATSLEDIANAIELLAATAASEKRAEQTRVMQSYRAGEAAAFVIVAKMLRATTIVPL